MKKKTIVTILQIVVTVGILGWIFHDPKKRADMWDAVHHDLLWMWILGGVLAYGIVEILGATRWLVLLRVQNIHIPWVRLVRLLMIGIFFNQVMPGGTGGDVVKIFYLLKETPNKKTQALLAVLMDRPIGLIGLDFCLRRGDHLWNWGWLTQGQPIPHFEFAWLFSFAKLHAWLALIPVTTQLLYTLLAILAATILGIVVSFTITSFGPAHKLPAKFPKRDIFVDLSVAYESLRPRLESLAPFHFPLLRRPHFAVSWCFYSAARSIRV